jgi:hypothetical protein
VPVRVRVFRLLVQAVYRPVSVRYLEVGLVGKEKIPCNG